ncbi:hypothetical protein C6946_13295, partial [Burkholderia thailandensis]
RFHALERFHDLAVRESRLLHPVELPQRKNSTSDHTGFSGGLPGCRASSARPRRLWLGAAAKRTPVPHPRDVRKTQKNA